MLALFRASELTGSRTIIATDKSFFSMLVDLGKKTHVGEVVFTSWFLE